MGLCLQALMALKKGDIPGWGAQRKGGHAGPCRKRRDEAERARGLMLGSSPRVRREARGFRNHQTVPKICVVLETAQYPRRGQAWGRLFQKSRDPGPPPTESWVPMVTLSGLTTWAGPEGRGWLFRLGSQAGLGPRSAPGLVTQRKGPTVSLTRRQIRSHQAVPPSRPAPPGSAPHLWTAAR